MTPPRIASTRQDNTVYLRLTGRVTFAQSPALDAFIDACFKAPPERFVIDLNEAEHLDSTILGLLAKIARRLKAVRDRRPVLHVRRGDIQILVDAMGFDGAFEIVNDTACWVEGYVDIAAGVNDGPSTKTLLEAHQLLMDLNEKNRAAFRTTVDVLRKDLEP